MPIQKTFINGGMRIKHPSGVTSVLTIADLNHLKEINTRSISLFNEQIAMINADIAKIKNLEKKPK